MPLGQPAPGPETPPSEPEPATRAAAPEAAPPPAPAGRKVKVRVTMFPDPIDVDPGEIPALRSQGLLIEDTTATPEGTTPS